jgi:hypothetical protein
MIHHSFHAPSPSPQALPAALLFSKQLLLTEKSSVKVERDPSKSNLDNLTLRATTMTATLRVFEGYYHGGLNE